MIQTISMRDAVEKALEQIVLEAAKKDDFGPAAALIEDRCGFSEELLDLVVGKLNADVKRGLGAPAGRGVTGSLGMCEEVMYRLSRLRADGRSKKASKSLVAEALKLSPSTVDRIIRIAKDDKEYSNFSKLYEIYDDPFRFHVKK